MISLIVPLYNEGDQVTSLIDHIGSLEGINEVILVDASDQGESRRHIDNLDPGRSNASAFDSPRYHIVRSGQPGRALQMNEGAAIASQPILIFLHCDTRLPQNASTLVKRALDDQHCWGRFAVKLDEKLWPYRLIGTMINLRSRLRSLATGDQCIFVTARAFRDVGGFPCISLMEDIALSKALSKLSSPALVATPVVTSARRWQKLGIVRTIVLMWKLRLLYWLGYPPERLSIMYKNVR